MLADHISLPEWEAKLAAIAEAEAAALARVEAADEALLRARDALREVAKAHALALEYVTGRRAAERELKARAAAQRREAERDEAALALVREFDVGHRDAVEILAALRDEMFVAREWIAFCRASSPPARMVPVDLGSPTVIGAQELSALGVEARPQDETPPADDVHALDSPTARPRRRTTNVAGHARLSEKGTTHEHRLPSLRLPRARPPDRGRARHSH